MITFRIIHPDKVLMEGEAEYILAPSRHGNLGIFEGHAPMFAELIKGDLIIKKDKEETLPIESGILKIQADKVVILVSDF
jgi:F0F1-type ATP synthase epsilon subunit